MIHSSRRPASAQNVNVVPGLTPAASKSDFATRVKTALEDKAEKIVLIRGDKDAKYSAIMEAMDELHAAGIEDIGLITEKKLEKPAGGQ